MAFKSQAAAQATAGGSFGDHLDDSHFHRVFWSFFTLLNPQTAQTVPGTRPQRRWRIIFFALPPTYIWHFEARGPAASEASTEQAVSFMSTYMWHFVSRSQQGDLKHPKHEPSRRYHLFLTRPLHICNIICRTRSPATSEA